MQSEHLLRISIFILALGLVSCQSTTVRAPEAPNAAIVHDTKGAIRYEVDGAASTLHILVYRGGAMARMGHNHVVSSKGVRGALFVQKDFSRSSIELTLPVASMSVDDAAARAVEGEDFAAEVPPDAREGTRHNLLRPEVLDGEHFPIISLQSVSISGTRDHPTLTMRITIKNVARDIPVMALVSEKNDTLTASGEFAIKQTDFGITPFSVALGALQVQDQLKIKFSIVSRKQK